MIGFRVPGSFRLVRGKRDRRDSNCKYVEVVLILC